MSLSQERVAQERVYYAFPSGLTASGAHAKRIESLPDDVGELVRVIQGLLIYDVVATDFYGVRLTEEQQQAIHLRGAQSVLDAALALDAGPLHRPRPGSRRLAGRCDRYSRLLTALLRAKGVPARARCGFADYFQRGRFEDHWTCEYWHPTDRRWVMVDAQLDEVWCKMLAIDFPPLDVPRDRFITAGQAWQRCRHGEADASTFGLSFVGLAGLWFVAGNLVRDIAALNKMELLPWDVWGAQPALNARLSADQLVYFDALAPLTLAADTNWTELRARYESDPGLRVGPRVFNALRQRMETV